MSNRTVSNGRQIVLILILAGYETNTVQRKMYSVSYIWKDILIRVLSFTYDAIFVPFYMKLFLPLKLYGTLSFIRPMSFSLSEVVPNSGL